MLNVIMLSAIMLNDIMLSVIMLNVIMLTVIILNVAAPCLYPSEAEREIRLRCRRREPVGPPRR
jgi:hypothetical protein